MSKIQNTQCIHCLGFFTELTEDHILPKSWYPLSTPANTEKFKVPSCEKCNKKLGAIEEIIFYKLAMCLDKNELAAQGLYEKFIKTISAQHTDPRKRGRQEKIMIDVILKNFANYPYDEKNTRVAKGMTPKPGIRSHRMIKTSHEELAPFCYKIIKGLEYKLRKRYIENIAHIHLIVLHANNQEEENDVNRWKKLMNPYKKNINLGPGFIVNYGENPQHKDQVIYEIHIWNHLEIWAFITE